MILGGELFGLLEKRVISCAATQVWSESALEKLTFAVWTLLFRYLWCEGPLNLFVELFFIERVVDLYRGLGYGVVVKELVAFMEH